MAMSNADTTMTLATKIAVGCPSKIASIENGKLVTTSDTPSKLVRFNVISPFKDRHPAISKCEYRCLAPANPSADSIFAEDAVRD